MISQHVMHFLTFSLFSYHFVFNFQMQSSLLLPQEKVQSIMTDKILKFHIMLMMKMVTVRSMFEEVSYMLLV